MSNERNAKVRQQKVREREKLDMLKELATLSGEIHTEELKLNMRVTDIIIQILKD